MDIVGKLAFAAFLIALVVGLVAALGTHFHAWRYETGMFGIFPIALYSGAAGILLGLAWALAAFFLNAGTASTYGVAGLVGSLIIMANPLYLLFMVDVAHEIPPIHDITTDTEHPPEFVALLRERAGATNGPDYDGPKLVRTFDGKMRTVSSLEKKYYDAMDIRPYANFYKAKELFRRALDAANAMGWTIVAAVPSPEGGRIEATDTSFFFGTTDDIVIRVEPSGIGARLDIRSKSREGDNDFGANAAHIKAYMKRLSSG
jgi:uncharacterized protein (DUF1499 family)